MKYILYITLSVMILFCNMSKANAANKWIVTDTSEAYPHLLELEALLNNVSLTFGVWRFREMTDTAGVSGDTLWGSYAVWGTQFYSGFVNAENETQLIDWQNEREHIRLESSSKVIYLEKRIPVVKAVFYLNLLDNQFVQAHVQRIYAIDSLNYKLIKVEFKPESPYLLYTLTYDSVHAEAIELNYAIKKIDVNGEGGYERVKLKYENWYLEWVPNIRMSSNFYYIRKDGVYVMQPEYTDYEILDFSAF